ncbi:MAG TPA: hypothetical protein VLG76_06745 [Rhabdochlamydiaceae bacterium]|nr:hypothetical protein [Rhabdochlamydiaceae bacterium]
MLINGFWTKEKRKVAGWQDEQDRRIGLRNKIARWMNRIENLKLTLHLGHPAILLLCS